MKRALRYPSRWAGRWRTLGTTTVLSVALGACSSFYGTRDGTIEYPGSGAGPGASAVYVVKEKDTVESLSQRYGVPVQTIVDRNRLQQPYTLRAGQSLDLPGARPDTVGGATSAVATAPPGPVKRESLAPPKQGETKPGEAPRSSAASGEPTPLSPPAKHAAAETSVTVPATPPRFAWPVKGKVLVPYGSSGGQKSDGIDIQAETGAPVKAADGGKVVYAGSEVAHLGNLVLVQHPGGYITAYGNNDALLVKKGDEVKKGQVIAKAGSSGGVASPRVHFEVRKGGSQTVDPASVLPAQ